MPEQRECLLQHALHGHERCPGSACPFYEDGECRLQELQPDINTNPELARFLLDLRARLAPRDGWQPFRRLGKPVRR
jgi:hypothetical protein